MCAALASEVSQFALDVADGLGRQGQKQLSPVYFYDDLGSALFEAITLLPEYGVTRADQRLLRILAPELLKETRRLSLVAELGSGTGKKTYLILQAAARKQATVTYCPIDVSSAALEDCRRELSAVADVRPICATWMEGLAQAMRSRMSNHPMLLLFLGSSIGNLSRLEMPSFFSALREQMRPGDFFLLGADLVKSKAVMQAAYDDATGVTAAFNLNLLARINRELGANFDLRRFTHEARWNEAERRIEMHLLSQGKQTVEIHALQRSYAFAAGESIWTESSHKFCLEELDDFAHGSGFTPARVWVDQEWPFAEVLWQLEANG